MEKAPNFVRSFKLGEDGNLHVQSNDVLKIEKFAFNGELFRI